MQECYNCQPFVDATERKFSHTPEDFQLYKMGKVIEMLKEQMEAQGYCNEADFICMPLLLVIQRQSEG